MYNAPASCASIFWYLVVFLNSESLYLNKKTFIDIIVSIASEGESYLLTIEFRQDFLSLVQVSVPRIQSLFTYLTIKHIILVQTLRLVHFFSCQAF